MNNDTPPTAADYAHTFRRMDNAGIAERLRSVAADYEADHDLWAAALLREAAYRISAQ